MDSAAAKLNSMKKFDADASNYAQTSDGKFCARVYPAILDELNRDEGQTILDIGCGTGILLSQVKDRSNLCGLDLSAGMIEQAKLKLGDRAELVVGDAENLPWPEGFFDTVLCSFSFHHYPKPDAVLREMYRVLKTGGRLILADPWMPPPFLQLMNLMIRFSRSGDFHEYSKKEIMRLLHSSGFRIDRYRHPTQDTFLLTAEKE